MTGPVDRRSATLIFGDELRRWSRAAGVGPRGLARRTGLDEATVLAIEGGAQLPGSEDVLWRILVAARATPDQADRAVRTYRALSTRGTRAPAPPVGVFVSYRRSDEQAFTGRLADRLVARFGADRVFLDVDSIEPGLDFVEVLDDWLGRCAVLVAVIGRGWLGATDGTGRRRLDDPDDFVRVEIERALSRGIRVIPVLVDGVPMPGREGLPEKLAPLARRQAVPISHARFGVDCARLLSTVERVLGERTPS